MHPGYILYSTRLNAYIGNSGTGTSEWKDARIFSHEEAMKRCVRARQHDGTFDLLPISLLDIMEHMS